MNWKNLALMQNLFSLQNCRLALGIIGVVVTSLATQNTFAGEACLDLFAGIESQRYRGSYEVIAEDLIPRSVPTRLFVDAPAYRNESATQIDWSKARRSPFEEFFAKVVVPGVTGRWERIKYKLSSLISPRGNEVVLAMDTHHTYLLIHDAATRSITRIDGNVAQPVRIRRNYEVVQHGVYFRFDNISPEAMVQMNEVIASGQKFYTCTHAACTILDQAGINLGPNGSPIPRTTAEALQAMVQNGFYRDEVPVETEIFTTSAAPVQQYFEHAGQLSGIIAGTRKYEVRSFLAVLKYSARTAYHWMFVGSPVRETGTGSN